MTHDHDHIPLVRLGQGDYTRDYFGGNAGDTPRPASNVLTSTRLSTMRRCLRQHYLRYELGLARDREDAALRIGSAFHKGLEARHGGLDRERAVAAAIDGYDAMPDWANATAWQVERETVAAMLEGHFWRYGNDDVEYIAVERTFELPLIDPATGIASPTFTVAGKIDAVVRLPDGRIAVLEYKTSGEDIGRDAEYWLRLRIDPQISLYVLAARALGFDAATVLYDVTRKPTIRLRRDETPTQFGERLRTDIGDRPDYYFARREIPRLEQDLAEHQPEVWQQARALVGHRDRAEQLGRDAQHAWFRNVGRFTCGTCSFADLCLQSIAVDPTGTVAPSGFRFLSNVHPELTIQGDPQ